MRGTQIWNVTARRSWWWSLAVAALLGVPACTNDTERNATTEQSLLAEIGPPLPDAVVWETPWYRGAGVWYDHRSDAPAVLAWLEALPGRLGCDHLEADELTPPVPGRSRLYRLTCRLDRDGRTFVISVQTMLSPSSASTVIAAHLDAERGASAVRSRSGG